MGSFAENVAVCHRCEHARGCNGFCPCKADARRRDIIEIARANACPEGYFGQLPLSADDSPEQVRAVLSRATRLPLPDGWERWPGVVTAHAQALSEFLTLCRSSPVLHVFHGLDLTDHPDCSRNVRARQTWEGPGVTLLPFHPARTAIDLGDSRPLPYINDLLDWACAQSPEDGIIVWSNLDVCLIGGAYGRIREALAWQDACFSRRLDVDDASAEPPPRAMYDTTFEGMDLLAFRPHWWRRVRHEVPDMFVANTQFDTVLRLLAARDSPVAEFHPRIIYHRKHGESWWQANGSAPSSLHNRREWEAWWAQYHPAYNADGKIAEPLVRSSALPPRAAQGRIHWLRKLLERFPRGMDVAAVLPQEDRDMLERLCVWEPPLVIVEPGHHGDFLYLLPAMKWLHEHGHRVIYCHKPGYAECAEGIDWIRCIPYESDERAAQFGRLLRAGRGVSWAQSSWSRTGVPMDQRHTLPLILDNRRPEKEAELIAQWFSDSRPAILFNGLGHSSPFDRAAELLEHLRRRFGGCQVIDCGRGEKLRDLCGPIERAAVLVTVDTATLHLSYATRTPTIALLPDNAWQASEPREHWKLHLGYRHAMMPEGLAAIDQAIEQVLAGDRKPMNFARAAHGAAGVARALVGLGGADGQMVRDRMRHCRDCPHNANLLGVIPTCDLCGCQLQAKVRNRNERCPAGRW